MSGPGNKPNSQPPTPPQGWRASEWIPGAQERRQAPVSPDDLNKRERKRRLKRSRGAGALARFFTKQALWFIALAVILVVVDVFLYIVIATHEMDRNYLYGTPATVTRTTSEQLAESDGAYELAPEAAASLDEQGAWAQLIAPDGQVAWERNVPELNRNPQSVTADNASHEDWGAVPSSYTLNQVALISHYRALNGYQTFLWERDDGMLLVGFPPRSYETMVITWPKETWESLPQYIFGVVLLDLLILFGAYVVSRRRTQRAVEPINDALDALSQGKKAQVNLRGDLQPIADQINETSDILEHKDRARVEWIRGVSHDIRTPLSLIIAKSDAIASDADADDALRSKARAIRTQGVKIKDLVADLNAASQLAFASQPLNLERVLLPKLLRNCAATYLNSGFDETHPLEFHMADDCAQAVALGDERMLVRMVENLLANARLHNPEGCSIRMSLSLQPDKPGFARVEVADDGAGITSNDLATLRSRIEHARTSPDGAVPDDAGHGLGLALVDRIATAHGGSLEIDGAPDSGLMARILIPLA